MGKAPAGTWPCPTCCLVALPYVSAALMRGLPLIHTLATPFPEGTLGPFLHAW